MRVQIVWAASSELSGHPSRGQSKGLYEWGNVNMETEREHVTSPAFFFARKGLEWYGAYSLIVGHSVPT